MYVTSPKARRRELKQRPLVGCARTETISHQINGSELYDVHPFGNPRAFGALYNPKKLGVRNTVKEGLLLRILLCMGLYGLMLLNVF